MKILFYNHAPELGGAERSLLAILTQAQQAGHEVRLLVPPGPLFDEAVLRSLPVVAMPAFEVGYSRSPSRLLQYSCRLAEPVRALSAQVAAFRPDVLHANTVRAGMVATPALALRRGRPALVVHARDGLKHGRTDWVVTRAIGVAADTVIAISHYVAESLHVPRRKIRVLHNAIDLAAYRRDVAKGAALRAAMGIPAGVPVVALVGQITPWKGQREAIDALGLARRAIPDLQLVVAGSVKFRGAHRRYDNEGYFRGLVARASGEDVAGHVQLVGEVEEAGAIYAAVDALVVPSYEEPFGRVVIEAMAAGTPVVATAGGGIPEIIEPEQNGLLVPIRDVAALADAMVRIVRDRDLAARLVAGGQSRVAGRFAMGGYMAQLEGIWRATLSGGVLAFPEEPPRRWITAGADPLRSEQGVPERG